MGVVDAVTAPLYSYLLRWKGREIVYIYKYIYICLTISIVQYWHPERGQGASKRKRLQEKHNVMCEQP